LSLKGVVRKCLYCGKEFEPRSWNQAFCNSECHYKYIKKKRKHKLEPKRICRWCQKPFKPEAKSIFCSPECNYSFYVVKRRLFNIIIFNSKRLDCELAKLQDLGKDYRFPKEFSEFNSPYYFKELIKNEQDS